MICHNMYFKKIAEILFRFIENRRPSWPTTAVTAIKTLSDDWMNEIHRWMNHPWEMNYDGWLSGSASVCRHMLGHSVNASLHMLPWVCFCSFQSPRFSSIRSFSYPQKDEFHPLSLQKFTYSKGGNGAVRKAWLLLWRSKLFTVKGGDTKTTTFCSWTHFLLLDSSNIFIFSSNIFLFSC